jgi:hypothetical protein
MSMGRSSMGKQIAVTRSSRDGGAKKVAFGGTKKMKAGGSTSSKPEPKYKDLRDRLDGGGPGKSGSTFSGGPLAKIGNALGIKPMAPAMATSGGGADSGQAAARVDAQRAAGLAARNYKGNPDNSGGNGPSAVSAGAGAADAAKAPTKVMKQTYIGGPAAGYRPGVDPEHQYFKTEEVDATTPEVKPMKKGGMVRGYGCAKRGVRKARSV